MNLSSFGRRLLQAVDATTFGTILGLGTAAYKNTGTSGNTVPLLDGVNTWSGIQTFSANPSVTGGAISFPATQVPSASANDLDDYEEGTFTPTIIGTTTAGAGTYSSQAGVYTKIGRSVTFNATLSWSAHTGTGNMRLGGLPFTVGANAGGPLAFRADNLTFPGSFLQGFYVGGTATVAIETAATGAAATALAMDTSASLLVAGTYNV